VTLPSNRIDRRARGFIVVAVLWILAALSALVLIYMSFVTNTAVVVAASSERVQTDALVSAGIPTVRERTAPDERSRPCNGRVRPLTGGCPARPARAVKPPAVFAWCLGADPATMGGVMYQELSKPLARLGCGGVPSSNARSTGHKACLECSPGYLPCSSSSWAWS